VQDGTNGSVQVVVGPCKISIAGTDVPVAYNHVKRIFDKVSKLQAIQQCPSAKEGQYIVLHNPQQKEEEKFPNKGPHEAVQLMQGSKIVIPGPVTFAPFPGQFAEVIEGHQLRSNQYLVVRV